MAPPSGTTLWIVGTILLWAMYSFVFVVTADQTVIIAMIDALANVAPLAVLALGADGAVLGTRLWASKEAMGPNSFKDALVAAKSADDVIRTRAFDTIANSFRSLKWPSPYDSSGVLRNKTTKQWDDDSSLEKALSTSEGFKIVETFKVASQTSDPVYAPVYAGKGVGKIHSIESAFEIISRIEQEIVGVISNASKVLPTAPNSGA